MKSPPAWSQTWLARLRLSGHGQRLFWGPSSPDSDKVVDRARPGRHAKPLSEGYSDLSVRPAPLAEPADQVRIWLKLALGRPVIGLCEKICNLVIEVHVRVAASTVRHCPGLSGKYPGISGVSGVRLFQGPDGPGQARTAFGSVRACPAVRNRRTTYCVSHHNIEYCQNWRCSSESS